MPGNPKNKIADFTDDPASLARLPEENPNPVLRINGDGSLRYANSPAQALIDSVDREAAYLRLAKEAASATEEQRTVDADFNFDSEIYAMAFIPVADRGYTNVFGRNVTAERRAQREVRDLAKFPSENPNPVMRSNRDGRVIFANSFAKNLPGLILPGDPPRFNDFLVEKVREVFRLGEAREVEIDSEERIYLYQVNPVAGEDYVNIYGREITAERQATEALLTAKDTLEERVRERTASIRLLENIVIAANSAESLEAALQTALHEICLYAGWPVGHAYIAEDGKEAGRLVPKGLWHIDSAEGLTSLSEATQTMRFGGGDDLPERAMEEQHVIWIEHLNREPDFPRAAFTEEAGLKSGIAFPVLTNGQVVAVLEFFTAKTIRLDESILTTLNNVGTQLGSVAERKRSEEALRRSQLAADQAHYRLVDAIEAISEGFALFDQDECLILCNTKFKELVFGNKQHLVSLGMSFGEMIRAIVYSGQIPDAIGSEEEWVEQRLDKHHKMERLLVHNNDDLWLQIDEYRTGEGGFVALYADVTELKEHEQELSGLVEELGVARDDAVTANATKSAFLANMSHELRTPMNAIIGYSEMLSEDAEDDGLDDMLEDLSKITAAGKHLLSLINDILDLSKIEAGKMDLFLETFPIAEMMKDVSNTAVSLVEKNNNKSELIVAEDAGDMYADMTKIRQVLFNLISNAAKFTKDGTISLIASREIRGELPWIRFAISDTGIGIPEDKIDKIFQEFSQADESTTKDYGGTGLGLTLTKRFCEMMGGEITVESEVGVGSSFIIALPAVVAEMSEATEDAVEENADHSATEKDGDEPHGETPDDTIIVGSPRQVARSDKPVVLVIDDEDTARHLLRRHLESEGCKVVTARDGDEGLAKALELQPNLITLDVMMPGMDGWTVLKKLKSSHALKDIPVVTVSFVGDRALSYSLGAVEALQKPVDRASLRHLIERYAQIPDKSALIVEDDPAARAVIKKFLESEKWQVEEAPNGAEGLQKASEARFGLILLDLMMPVMDGFEFLQQLRQGTSPSAAAPVVVVTAMDLSAEDRARLMENVERVVSKTSRDISEVMNDVQNTLATVGFGKPGNPASKTPVA